MTEVIVKQPLALPGSANNKNFAVELDGVGPVDNRPSTD